jgi:dTDP-4-dehydrorhamnose reductase
MTPPTPASLEKTVANDQPTLRTVLVIGSYGMLGRDLVQALERSGFNPLGWDLDHIDITRLADVQAKMPNAAAEVVINCAAYTAVDRAETEVDLANAVNRDGVAHLAESCAALHIPLIHISTDYVFDGNADWPYREDEATNPIGVYAISKWEGEEVLRQRQNQHLIVRTAWLYGVHGHNFVKTILRLAGEREEIRVVADQHGCPTWTMDLAAALVAMVRQIIFDRSGVPWGTYHYCGGGQTTWHGFAETIVALGRRWQNLQVQRVVPIATAEYPVPARRPPWSVLDCGKISTVFGITPHPWQVSLEAMMRELYGAKR